MQINRVGTERYTVGEGPLWDVDRGELLLVDIVGQSITIYDSAHHIVANYKVPQPVVAATRAADDALLVLLADGYYRLDEKSGTCLPLSDFRVPAGGTLNDGKVDRAGRLIAVSADRGMKDPLGGIYSLGDDGAVERLDEGFILSNGPCWSPDGKLFYLADSIKRKIFCYDYDLDGRLSDKRVFVDTSDLGMPDGATIDAEGYLWMAMCGEGTVIRFAPDGSIDRTLELPTKWTASVTFGGKGLDRLYVSTLDPAVVGGTGDALCGALFVIDGLGVRGLAEPRAAFSTLHHASDIL